MSRQDNLSLASDLRAIGLVARMTLSQAVRWRLAWFTGAAALLLIGGACWLRDLHFGGAELRFLLDLGFGAIGIGALLVAVLGTAHLFFGDLDGRMAAFVLARPVPRTSWLLGKLAGALGALAFLCGSLTVLTGALTAGRAEALGVAWPGLEIVRSGGLLWLKAAIASAATLFVCTYARTPLLAGGAGLLFVVIGHLRPVASAWPSEASLRGVVGAVVRLWPDLTRFDPLDWMPGTGAALAGYGLGYVALFAGAAALAFSRRDL